MKVTVTLELKADRKEPLGDLIRRVADLFDRAAATPRVVATFADGLGGSDRVSAVERAVKKYPHLAPFERSSSPAGAFLPAARRLAFGEADDDVVRLADVLSLADGVPRSLPFHVVNVLFGHTAFGEPEFAAGLAPPPGIAIVDSWWVNKRNRGLTALYAVDGDAAAKVLPDPPAPVAQVLAGLGKPKRKGQFVPPAGRLRLAAARQMAGAAEIAGASAFTAITPIVAKYRAEMRALIERLALPHDLPPEVEAAPANAGASGPLKPALVQAFTPRGFDCRGESGMFTLRRRTPTNLVVDLELDVGTWSRSVTAMFHVHGPGFKATIMPPVTARSSRGQYPIGDTGNWECIVANLAAIVDELSKTFVPEIEAAVGPAPAWFEPGR